MDSNSKKREGQQLQIKDMLTHQLKRLKCKSSDYTIMFLKCLSLLSDDKKDIVRKLGFGSVLEFSCCSNINDMFHWLLKHFDANTATANFEKGFSFSLSPAVVYKIMGIPFGAKIVQLKATKESIDFFKRIVQTEAPTVEQLCSLLTNELDEKTFPLIFMQLLLSAFIAPNGCGTASPIYYHILINIPDIPNYDWCSFTLKWLLLHIKNYQSTLLEGNLSDCGGCKIILVIAYFEFLITSEFTLGANLPRLPLWTTDVVNSYIALDSVHGPKQIFGRLARKHISSTPFGEIGQLLVLQMPTEVQEYINIKFKDNAFSIEKSKLESLTQNFFHKMIQNSIPTIKCYIDDLVQNTSSISTGSESQTVCEGKQKGQDTESLVMVNKEEQDTESMVMLHKEEQDTGVHNPWYSEEEVGQMIETLHSSGKLRDYIEETSSKRIMQDIVRNFSQSCIVDDSNITLPAMPAFKELERSLYPLLQCSDDLIHVEPTTDITEYLRNELLVTIREVKREMYSNQEYQEDYKLSWENMTFYLPTQGQRTGARQSTPSKELKSAEQDNWGFSLNERLLGKRMKQVPLVKQFLQKHAPHLVR